MPKFDTSAEAVERRAQALNRLGCHLAAATLRALAAERDDLRMCAEAEADAVNDIKADRDRLAAENVRMREALVKARDRIECEDWVGTCGCGVTAGPCECLDEHNAILAMIDEALTGGADNG